MARILYLSWLKKHYPIEYAEFDRLPVGARFYDETYEVVRVELERITGERILRSGDGYSFVVFSSGYSGGRAFESPDALIKYVRKVRASVKSNPGFYVGEEVDYHGRTGKVTKTPTKGDSYYAVYFNDIGEEIAIDPDELHFQNDMQSNPGKWPTFKSVLTFQDHLRRGGTTPDVVKVAGILFTMDNYDWNGHYITYGNRKHEKMMEVETPSGRYKHHPDRVDFSDAIVTIDELTSWRTDINYLE